MPPLKLLREESGKGYVERHEVVEHVWMGVEINKRGAKFERGGLNYDRKGVEFERIGVEYDRRGAEFEGRR